MTQVTKRTVLIINLSILSLFVSILFSSNSHTTTNAQSPNDKSDAAKSQLPLSRDALNVFGALNEWRISAGLWPLVLNDTLNRMAQDHANYLIALSELPKGGDIHNDAQGRTPPQRAFQSYSWPAYANNAQWVAAGEVAYVGANERRAIEYWQGSDIHNRTVTSSAYREAGVGVVPHPYGYLYIVVLGSQPDVLPVSLDPLSNRLYFTQEAYRYAKGNTQLGDITQVQIVNDESKIDREGWRSWAATIEWNDGLAARVAVYSDGRNQVLYPFTTWQSVAWTRPLITAIEEGQVRLVPPPMVETSTPISATQSDLPTAFPTSTPFGYSAATAFPTNPPLPTVTLLPTATPTRPAGNPQLLLVYDTRSFTLINISTGPLNLSSMIIESANGRLAATRWDTQFATVPMNAIPANGCVRAWSWNEGSNPPAPSECNFARSVLTVAPTALFWTADFSISGASGVWETCSAVAGRCEVFLPNP